MFERILVPLDSSKVAEQVLPAVSLLAKQLKQPVTLVAVLTDFARGEELNPVASEYEAALVELGASRQRFAKEYLEGVRTRLQAEGIAVEAVTVTGDAGEQILSAAAKNQSGLIAMATHGRVGPERWFLGSVADKVVRGATAPVLLIRPQATPGPAAVTNILLPLDRSELAEAAIPAAVFMAKAFGVPLCLLRTVDRTQITYAADPYMGAEAVLSPQIEEALESEAREYLEQTAERIRKEGVTVTTQFSFLPASLDITDTAAKTPGTLIIMASHGRTGFRRAILGSVADRVVRSSTAPVIIVRPA